jgi:hypothetical protein
MTGLDPTRLSAIVPRARWSSVVLCLRSALVAYPSPQPSPASAFAKASADTKGEGAHAVYVPDLALRSLRRFPWHQDASRRHRTRHSRGPHLETVIADFLEGQYKTRCGSWASTPPMRARRFRTRRRRAAAPLRSAAHQLAGAARRLHATPRKSGSIAAAAGAGRTRLPTNF